jgi:two-component system, NtrC family, nitrogen regulation sensor histidine kinase NtrY
VKSSQRGICFWGFPWILLTVLLYSSIFGIRLYLNHRNSPRTISREFQKKSTELDATSKVRIDFLISKFDTTLNTPNHPEFDFIKDPEEDSGFSLFVYKEDSLIYWNNNKVIIPAGFNKASAKVDFACQLKNGWYRFHCIQKGSFYFLVSYLIKSEFPFQNEFIKNQFSSRLQCPESVAITGKIGSYPIYTGDGTYLYSLDFKNYRPYQKGMASVIFLVFILGSLCFFYFLYRVFLGLAWFINRKNLLVVFYSTIIVFLRIVQHYSGFPAEIYRSELFGPAWYSSSDFLPSLGDFALNAMILFLISLVVYKQGNFQPRQGSIRWKHQFEFGTISLLFLLVFFQGVGYFMTDLVINSSLSLNLQNISALTYESGFGLFIITLLLFSLWLVSTKMFEGIFVAMHQRKWMALSAIIAACMYSLICWLTKSNLHFTITVFFLVYTAWFFGKQNRSLFPVQNLLFFLCFYAILATILLNRSNQSKESDKLNLLAGKLMTRRNPVTEVLYEQVERKLQADSILKQWINPESASSKLSQDSLVNYLQTLYFKDYWKKYQIQITCCDPMKELRIQPQGYLVNCDTYFRGIIDNYGEATVLPNLFFLDYGFGKAYYLAVFSGKAFFSNPESQPAVFIEFNLKNAFPDPGYPGLLMDNTRVDLPNLSDYSYGLFQNGRLIRAVGVNAYKMQLSQYQKFSSEKPFFTEDHMIHFQYRINDTDALIISKKEDTFFSFATPFSYLFILFSAVALLVIMGVNFPKNLNPVLPTLRNRLHFSLIGILVVTMLAIGIVQVINILQINSKKNIDNLRERAYSVVVEVQHKYSPLQGIQAIPKNELEDFLVKLANVFFTDINIYNDKGMLIASSRPQIFEEGLLSERMNATACKKMVTEQNSIFIHKESIGEMQFNSAYLPFYNEHDQLLGYVNLPYFAKQDESKKEISSFLVTFLNIYILLILFGIFVTVLISNYITSPLALLAKKMSQLRLGMVNEKITWKPNDEIGQLVSEYNRMIDELSRSAEMLAMSERESAWREMARQVAHEIKNPLTPMKLSAQHLEKAWKEHAPDWDQRLARFTKTLVEQIDTLSVIASDFSDFAKMPTVVVTRIDLEEVVRFVLSLYQDATMIHYEFKSEVADPFISGDRSQLIRLFTNLLNNALQAIGDHSEGIIRIHLTKERNQMLVKVSDNGCGISPERAGKIFQPDFTTKTSGMGLGLAIVKGIVEGMSGEISFTSEEQKGTTFIIKFPVNGE